MELHFCKYQGAGNDFILLDNRQGMLRLEKKHIANLCDRHFGIGADGLMMLETAPDADFRMQYWNADGGLSTLCGNGSRCIVAFANKLGMIGKSASFVAADGLHHATILEDGQVSLRMNDVTQMRKHEDAWVLDTGSPHIVKMAASIGGIDVKTEGRRIRQMEAFSPGGVNVNFVAPNPAKGEMLMVRTYERGVEDETLSCGTGVVAAAIAYAGEKMGSFDVQILTAGGELSVAFRKEQPNAAQDIVLTGPASFVYAGQIALG